MTCILQYSILYCYLRCLWRCVSLLIVRCGYIAKNITDTRTIMRTWQELYTVLLLARCPFRPFHQMTMMYRTTQAVVSRSYCRSNYMYAMMIHDGDDDDGTFAVSKYVAKSMLIRRWNARLVWGMQRQAASQIMATWRANAFLRSCQGSCGGGSACASSASGPALDDGRSYEYDLDSLD